MKRILVTGIAGSFLLGLAALVAVPVPQDGFASAAFAQSGDAACIDSAGSTTGFFCQPLSSKGKLIKACSAKRPKDMEACRAETALTYCMGRNFDRALQYGVDSNGNLAQVVCLRGASQAAATPAPSMSTASAPQARPVEEWQPMYNVNLLGYDHREFGLSRADDWKSCKAACDGDGQCRAWTVSQENSMCYLKWDDNPELLSSNSCCISAIKGMASAGDVAQQKTVRTPEELKRLGSRIQNAAEDEVGRRTEDKVRRALGKILGN